MLDWIMGIEWSQLLFDSLSSVERVIIGVFVAVILGISLGLLRSGLPLRVKSNLLIKLLFEAPTYPPPIAWIPFVVIIFGIGELPAYCIVLIGAFAPIFTSTYEAAESIPIIISRTAKSMEVEGWRYQIQIVLPASLPKIFTGIRLAVKIGWFAVIAAEMVSGQSGLGYSINLSRLNMQYDIMAINMILIGCIGHLLNCAATNLELKIISWRE